MKKVIPIVLILGMFGWVLVDFIGTSTEETDEDNLMSGGSISSPPLDDAGKLTESDEVGLGRGEFAPDFEVVTLDGEQAKLSDYQGSKVMLNFWATWCPPCRAEMPDMQKLYEKEDVVILAMNMTSTESSVEGVQDFVDEFELTFPILLDEADITSTYRVAAYPTTYMIDSNGRTQFITLGAMNYDQMYQQLGRMD
ncbi:peroxiredoxin family protein [Oceanobacillus sp. CAU 1775]